MMTFTTAIGIRSILVILLHMKPWMLSAMVMAERGLERIDDDVVVEMEDEAEDPSSSSSGIFVVVTTDWE